MNKLKSKIFKLIEANSVDIEESSKNGIIAHYVDVDELVDDLFSLYDVSQQRELLLAYEDYLNEYHTKEDRIKQVNKYLKANNCG